MHRVERCRAPEPSELQGRGGLSFTKQRRVALARPGENSASKRKQRLGLREKTKAKQVKRRKKTQTRKRQQNLGSVYVYQVPLASAVMLGIVELQVWLVPFSCLWFRGPCISEKHSGLHATAYVYVFVIPRVVGHLYPVAVISAEEGGISPN